MDSYEANLIYGVAWISFGLIHSLFAATKIKDMLEPLLMGYYRVSYNLLALSHIIIIWFIGSHVFNNLNFIIPKNRLLSDFLIYFFINNISK